MEVTGGEFVHQDRASQEARRLLGAAWARTDGTIPLPVDPVIIASRLGVKVFLLTLPQDLSGALAKDSAEDEPRILLNATQHVNRRRFTCAHEIGHYIQRRDSDTLMYVDRRAELAKAGTNPDEVYANAFAANLLMPEDAVRRFWLEGDRAPELAIRFGVSVEAASVRVQTLGLQVPDE